MNRVTGCLLSLSLLAVAYLATPANVQASDYQIGYRSPYGYTYHGNNVWSYGGSYYTRHYDYYSRYYIYTPTTYYQAPTYTPPPVVSSEAELFKLAADRQKHKQLLELAKTLGLENTIGPAPGYAVPYGYSVSGYGYSHQIPVTGATLYGPSAFTYNAQRYTALDVLSLYQMAHQQTQLAISSGKEATIGFRDIMAPVVDASARVTIQDAKVTNAIRLLQAVDPPTADLKGYQFKAGPGIPGAPALPPLPPKADNPNAAAQELVDRLEQVMVKSNCVQCHGGKDPKGGLNIADYLDPAKVELRARVMGRISMQPSDPDYATKMMPRAMSGGPGVHLTAEEIQLFDAVKRLVEAQPTPMQPGGVPNGVRELRNNER